MKILIHGRKNGYTILFPKPTPTEFYSYASDIQSISANNYDEYYGKCFYTLGFVNKGCVFTKYIIGEDVERGQLGEIGISVFIPHTHRLPGADVKNLLDELIIIYNKNYITNNKIEEPKNNFEWSLFTSAADGFDSKLQSRSSDYENIIPGTQDPAYHHFESDSELIEHLDKPFQEEYNGYRQILFIDTNLRGAYDPLNALRNSGVEVNPDLKNEYFYLNSYIHSRGVRILANGQPRSEEQNNNKIRAKWQLEIRYTKDYYKPIIATGTILNRDSDIHKYLDINGNNIRIKYDAFQPIPETKTFAFDVVTKKDGAKVVDAEIQVDSQPWQNRSDYMFSGEDLGRKHTIVARKGGYLISDVVRITPQEYSEPSIHLQLKEKRIVKIIARDQENGDIISRFKVFIPDKIYYIVTDQIEFVGDEIDKEWNIQIEKSSEYYPENKKFCPAKDGNEINFNLIKAKRQIIESGNYGYWEQHLRNRKRENENSSSGKPKTSFSKPAFIAILVFSGFVLIVTILALRYFLGNDKHPENYVFNKSDNTKYENVGDDLHDDSAQADSTTSSLTQNEQENQGQLQGQNQKENNPDQNNGTSPRIRQSGNKSPSGSKPVSSSAHIVTDSTNKTQKINNYIQGGDLRKDTLIHYLDDPAINQTLKTSIKLCLNLWSLDGTTNNSYSYYLKELNKDTNLKNSELKDFVDAMSSKKRPKYIKELPAQVQNRSLSEIKSSLQ